MKILRFQIDSKTDKLMIETVAKKHEEFGL